MGRSASVDCQTRVVRFFRDKLTSFAPRSYGDELDVSMLPHHSHTCVRSGRKCENDEAASKRQVHHHNSWGRNSLIYHEKIALRAFDSQLTRTDPLRYSRRS